MHALLLLTYCSDDDAIQELIQKLHIDKQGLLDFSNTLLTDKSVALAANIFDKHPKNISPKFVELMQ